jgi:polysaccharide biosynthesis transport protein
MEMERSTRFGNTKSSWITGQQEHSRSMSFSYIFAVLRHRLNFVLVPLAITLVIALLYLVYAPTRYTATALMVLDSKRSMLAETGIASEPQVDEGFVESQIQMLKSDNVATIVVEKLNLTEDPEFQARPTFFEKLISYLSAEGDLSSRGDRIQKAVDTLDKGLLVTRLGRSYVAQVSFTSLSRTKAIAIANAVTDAYIEDQLQAKSEVAKRASVWLQERTADLRSLATSALKDVQDFKSGNNLVIGADGKISTDLELQQLASSLADARAATARAQSRQSEIKAALSAANIEGVTEATVTDALNNPVIVKLREQYLDDKKQAAIWTTRLGRHHQAVSRLEEEMKGLERGIREEMQRIAETYRGELIVARSQEESIEKRLIEIFRNDSGNRQLQVRYRDFETLASSYRSAYENFLNKYTQIVPQQSFPSIEARVITKASIAPKTSPKIILTLALATLAGAGVGVAAAFLKGHKVGTIFFKEQLLSEADVTCIAVLPYCGKRDNPLFEKWTGESDLDRGRILTWIEGESRSNAPKMLFGHDRYSHSLAAELLNVQIHTDMRSFSRTLNKIAIVSPESGEGKSTVALSVAARAAASGKNVLLIDFDYRNPSITQFLGLEGQKGVTELMSGESILEEIIVREQHYGFDFVCGPTQLPSMQANGASGLETMINSIDAASNQYDYILFDFMPVLSMEGVSACEDLFDGFIMVVEWGETSLDDLRRVFQSAPIMRERTIGVVLNKVR